LKALFGRTTPRRLQFTAIENQSVRPNFQVGHDIAIGRTVAATKVDAPGDVGAIGDPSARVVLFCLPGKPNYIQKSDSRGSADQLRIAQGGLVVSGESRGDELSRQEREFLLRAELLLRQN
jgi:hypothetical protein